MKPIMVYTCQSESNEEFFMLYVHLKKNIFSYAFEIPNSHKTVKIHGH